MEKWEYITEIIEANINNEGAREYLARNYPNWKAPKYTPQAMQVHLDSLGEEGWELVTMHSIAGIGDNADVFYQGEMSTYSRFYLCVFKRRK